MKARSSIVVLAILAFFCAVPGNAQIRINAGGSSYTDANGNVWSADMDFNSGFTYPTSATISGTTSQPLFQIERYSNGTQPLIYTIPNLASGTYTVKLSFAEIYSPCFVAGCRVFNVKINGTPVLTNFDVFAKVGANAADVESFQVTVTNTLTIEFDDIANRATISAIEILPAQHSVTLNWTASPTQGVSYNVYRSDGAVWNPILQANVTTTSYVDTTIVFGSNYTYKVTAMLNGVESDFPSPVTVVTQ